MVRKDGGSDLVTREQFGSFELRLEWKLTGNLGNSGICYRVSEDAERPWHGGPEFQVVDYEGYQRFDEFRGDHTTMSGACYDLYAPAKNAARPLGEWNAVRCGCWWTATASSTGSTARRWSSTS